MTHDVDAEGPGPEPDRRAGGRRTRFMGVAVAALAVAGSFVYALQGHDRSATSAYAAVLGAPTNAAPFSPIGQFFPAGSILWRGGKPELLFVGTAGCPYCAVERWSVVKALSQFGTFSGLEKTDNGSGIPTYDLSQTRYRSPYVALVVDDADLPPFNKAEAQLFLHADSQGGTPLVSAGGYAMVGSYLGPDELSGRSFASVENALRNGSRQSFVDHINAEANVLTALLCRADGMQPRSVCGRALILRLVRSMK